MVSGNLKMLDTRIGENEHDVMKLFRFLRQDLKMKENQIVQEQNNTNVQDIAEYQREWVNTCNVEKPLVTKEFVEQADYDGRTLNKNNENPINIMEM